MSPQHDPRQRSADKFCQSPTGLGVCILAAGIAKRLEPISAIIAKPAFPLGGRIPIAELWVRRFASWGVKNIAMNLHRVPESIRGYFGSGERWGIDITYVDEAVPSGTLGGAIKMIRALQKRGFNPQRVFIPSGDIVSGIGIEHLEEMLDRHQKSGAVFSLMLAPVDWNRRKDFGTVILEGIPPHRDVTRGTYARVNEFLEKVADSPSNENNASNYLVETDFLLELEPYLTEAKVGLTNPCYDFGKHVLMGITGRVPHLEFLTKRRMDLYGYEPRAPWYDVGNKRDYLEVNRTVLTGRIEPEPPYRKTDWGWMGKDVEMNEAKVAIRGPVVIGDGCAIVDGVELGRFTVLGDGWKVGRGSRINDAVFWPYYGYSQPDAGRLREVAEGCTVENSIAVGGRLTGEVRDKTAHPSPDGSMQLTDLDWSPSGERA